MSAETSKLDAWLEALFARADALKVELDTLKAREDAIRKELGPDAPVLKESMEDCLKDSQIAELAAAMQRQADAEGRDRAARARQELDAVRGKESSRPASASRRKGIVRL